MFGPDCTEPYRDRIEAADIEQLDAWLDNILTAETHETNRSTKHLERGLIMAILEPIGREIAPINRENLVRSAVFG